MIKAVLTFIFVSVNGEVLLVPHSSGVTDHASCMQQMRELRKKYKLTIDCVLIWPQEPRT
jgi:hypothetical protein